MERTYHSRKFLFYVAGPTGSQVLYQQKNVFHHLRKNLTMKRIFDIKNIFWKLTKRIRKELRKEKLFFTSQQNIYISLTLVKTVRIRDLHRSRKFTGYFSCKKSFMQHPQFLLHNRHLSEHLRKS